MYLAENVYDAALNRIRWLFDEFQNVVVDISGGKDSTVVLNLALRVAEERGRLPLPVFFLDQEAEWNCVIEHIRTVMLDPRVQPYWLQVPIRLFNATSAADPWLWCWKEGEHWIREKETYSIHENRYGTDRFAQMFTNWMNVEFPEQSVAQLGGVRVEESPGRALGLTSCATYKWATWGKQDDRTRNQYSFYPIYDWTYKDVWRAIHTQHWPYCKLYDLMYQHGVRLTSMRVSNVHHETAVDKLYFLQELEPDTWNRITERLSGINTVGHLQKDEFQVSELPWMFASWAEYRDYLLEHLVTDPNFQKNLRDAFTRMDAEYAKGYYWGAYDSMVKAHIGSVLTNDWELIKVHNYINANRSQVGRKKRIQL